MRSPQQRRKQIQLRRLVVKRKPNGFLGGARPIPDGFEFWGAGDAAILTDGEINLGAEGGILSRGDEVNLALDDLGADLTVIAGLQGAAPDAEGFLRFYAGSGDDVFVDPSFLDAVLAKDLVDLLLSSLVTGDPARSDNPAAIAQLNDALDGLLNGVTPESVAALRTAQTVFTEAASTGDVALTANDVNTASDIYSLAYRIRSLSLEQTDLTNTQKDASLLGLALDVMSTEQRLSTLESADIASGRLNNFNRGTIAAIVLFDEYQNTATGIDDTFINAVRSGDNRYLRSSVFQGLLDSDVRLEQDGQFYAGDIVSVLSTVQTQDGGNLRAATPGGSIDAGTTGDALAGFQNKEARDLGYIVFREGNLSAYVLDSFNVNSSRAVTQGGGDLLMWAATGNIDAGRGTQSSASLAGFEPQFDAFGNFVDQLPLTVSGSGIQTVAGSDGTSGGLFLTAPFGIIDAGDAGISSDSLLVLAAQEVANADFIASSGPSFGVPTAAVPVAVGLTSLGDVTASATAAATEATQRAAAAQAEQEAASNKSGNGMLEPRIQVDVLKFGI